MASLSLAEIFNRTRSRGLVETSQRAVRRACRVLEAKMDLRSLDFPLLPSDIASSGSMPRLTPSSVSGAQRVAWLCTPPGAGSGGHTTFFRMVQAVQDAGHHCTILLYNRHNGDLDRHIRLIRAAWPQLTAEIAEVPAVIEGFDVCVASSWDTAHVLASRMGAGAATRPFYFVQDFEPYFYPHGSLYALAEDSYRFGFTHLALGTMVATLLNEDIGVPAITVPFGADTVNYHLDATAERSGVVFFARPGVDRRGYELGRLALVEFHRLHPEQEIHTYGAIVRGWEVPLTQHGTLSAAELNALYNKTLAGLALSFTNITLVAAEMLAAGTIAVLNDQASARTILTNVEAVWAPPTPRGLAGGLSSVVVDTDGVARAQRAAAHRETSWEDAEHAVVDILVGEKWPIS